MFNIFHSAASPGISDTTRRRTRPMVQPAGASHFTMIDGGRAAAPRETSRPSLTVVPPPTTPRPSSG